MIKPDKEILEDTIAKLESRYLQDKTEQSKILAYRMKEYFDVHIDEVITKFHEKYGTEAIPVLIGKHFIWSMLNVATRYTQDISCFFGLSGFNNPEEPGEAFKEEWGDYLKAMETDLDSIGKKLTGDMGALHYIVWVHEQSELHAPQGEEHMSIYSLNELRQSKDYARLFEMTCKRIEEIKKSIGL
jgi:hypothetical protein